MKKIYLIIIYCLIFVACKDECDHGFETNVNIPDILVGSWYEETANEEDVFSASGYLYGKFSNIEQAGETTGRYTIDSEKNRLSYTYATTGGVQHYADWKLSNVSRFQYTQTSDYASLTLGKIVETYQLSVGQTMNITFATDYHFDVLGYESTNARIASVTDAGRVKAEGEKGTAYIKIKTAEFNAWVKVVVGENRLDLWYDYPSLIGKSVDEVKQILGVPVVVSEDGYKLGYTLAFHAYIKYLFVDINKLTQKADYVWLHLTDGVPEKDIKEYLESRYYYQGESTNSYRYTTLSDFYSSPIQIGYDTKKNLVGITEIKMWEDYTVLFGRTSDQVEKAMNSLGYSYVSSSNAYSLNGSDKYKVPDSEYVTDVEFRYNTDNVVSDIVLYYPLEDINGDDHYQYVIWNYLNTKYIVSEDEQGEFYNADKTLKILFGQGLFVYRDLAISPIHENVLRNYWEGLGLTRTLIATKFGLWSIAYNNAVVYYNLKSPYISQCRFYSTTTGECIQVYLKLVSGVDSQIIFDCLDSQYERYKEEWTGDELTRCFWSAKKQLANGDLLIVYDKTEEWVIYEIKQNP